MKKLVGFGAAFVSVMALSIACNENLAKEKVADVISKDSLVKRGRYLVDMMGCNDCHSPKVMGPQGPMVDTARILSGHPASMPVAKVDLAELGNWLLFSHSATAVAGPWGVSFSANLTSDPSGIGNWTEKQFFTALRKGKYKGLEGARDLLPPMPWQNYNNATDEDLRAIFTYLKSTKPVNNIVPAPIPLAAIPK